MIEWRPSRRLGTATLVATILAIVVLDFLLVSYLRGQYFSFESFAIAVLLGLTAPFLGLLLYRLYQLRSLNYLLDRDSIIIRCGGARHVIPIHTAEVIADGEVTASNTWRWLRWPGLWLGGGRGHEVQHYATEPPSRQILVRTPDRAYAISPANASGFVLSVEARRALGPSQRAVQTTARADWMDWPFWTDRTAQVLILAGLLANVALFGGLAASFPGLPQLVPIHFSSEGMVDRIAPRIELLRIPSIGAIAWSVNALLGLVLHRDHPFATYLLAAVAVLVQGLLAVALYRIIT